MDILFWRWGFQKYKRIFGYVSVSVVLYIDGRGEKIKFPKSAEMYFFTQKRVILPKTLLPNIKKNDCKSRSEI